MYRIDKLLKENGKLFHTRDLALLWGIKNSNTLYTTIKRYRRKGILIPIQKGLYSTIQLNNLDPVKTGIACIHGYAYLSGEYILKQNGIIFQEIPSITLISSVSRSFEVNGISYKARQLSDKFLYNETGIYEEDKVKKATTERAIADLLYFNPKQYFDSKAVDWQKVRKVQKEIGYI